MPKFLVQYLVPPSVIDTWRQTDMEVRRPAEEKMRADWNSWMAVNGKHLSLTEVAGRTKRVTPAGVSDTRNDLLFYSIVEAETLEAAAKLFEGHPHLGIPQATIELTELRNIGGA